MAIISLISSTGSPTAVSTIAMVTRPADGIPAAPIAAAVAVKLKDTGQTCNLTNVSHWGYNVESTMIQG